MGFPRALLVVATVLALKGCVHQGRSEGQDRAADGGKRAQRQVGGPPTAPVRTLRLGCNEWQPYVGAAGAPEEGFAVDLTREALRRMGWKLDFRTRPWARCLDEMRRGALDGVLCAYYVPERRWHYSRVPLGLGPKWSDEFVILRRRGSAWRYRSPEDLKSARLTLVSGHAYPEPIAGRLRAGGSGLALVTGDDPTTRLLELVAMGRAEATVEQRLPLEAVLSSRPDLRSKVEEVGTLPGWRVYVALRPDYPNAEAVMRELDRSLLEVYRSAEFGRILGRYGLRPAASAPGPTAGGQVPAP
jgi:polar amino acid transport system substrate-binding protein